MQTIRKASIISIRKLPPFNYYHLTPTELGNTITLKPFQTRRPYYDDNNAIIEDTSTARISFSTAINGALFGVSANDGEDWDYDTYYIYATNKLNGKVELNKTAPTGYGVKYSKPSDSSVSFKHCVPDAKITKEVWATKPTKTMLVGRLEMEDGWWRYAQ